MTDESTSTDAIAADFPLELDLVLLTPVIFAKTEYTTLHLSEPTAGQLVTASKAGNSFEQLAALISANAKVLPGVVNQMRQRDFQSAAAFFAPFSEALPTISAI